MNYIFLDRDGVINEDSGFVYKIEEYRILPGVIEAIRLLNENEYKIIVISNQAGIGRGIYSEADMRRLHSHLKEVLAREGTKIEKFYFCPHHPEKATREEYKKDCYCRKPKPGMLLQAQSELGLKSLGEYFFIGDKDSDIQAGREAGCKTIRIESTYEMKEKADFTAADLYDAVTRIVLQ